LADLRGRGEGESEAKAKAEEAGKNNLAVEEQRLGIGDLRLLASIGAVT
jgi:hypothetical protein